MARPLASPPHPRRDESRRSLRGGRRSGVRYPDLCVSLRSRNPLALVAAVREELRLAGVETGRDRALLSGGPGNRS